MTRTLSILALAAALAGCNSETPSVPRWPLDNLRTYNEVHMENLGPSFDGNYQVVGIWSPSWEHLHGVGIDTTILEIRK